MTPALPTVAALRRSLAGLLLAVTLPALAQTGAGPLSRAEQRLFNDAHLHNVRPGTALSYDFSHAGTLDERYAGTLELRLDAGPDGRCCTVNGRFPEAQGPRALPQVEAAQANPVILYYLEHDLREMQRHTKGQPAYFRKRIRLALAESATVTETTVRWQGRELPALELHIRPYADDPMRARYERFAAKQYHFVLAEGVPGGVVQLRSLLPAPAGSEAALVEETLTLQGAIPAARTAPPSSPPGTPR